MLDEMIVRRLVSEGAALPVKKVVPSHEGTRPAGLYATLVLINDGRLGYPNVEDGEGDDLGLAQTVTYRQADYSLQFWRHGAVAAATAFDAWLQSELGLEALLEAGLAIDFPIDVQPVYPDVDDKREEQALISLGVLYADTLIQTVPTVDTARVTLKAEYPPVAIEETIEHG